MEETITISVKEYTKLTNDSDFLECLRAVGVDNWEGYRDALDMMEEED